MEQYPVAENEAFKLQMAIWMTLEVWIILTYFIYFSYTWMGFCYDFVVLALLTIKTRCCMFQNINTINIVHLCIYDFENKKKTP